MIEAVSKEKAVVSLKAEGKLPLKLEEQNMLNKDISFSFGSPVKTRDIAVFCRQFHSIIAAGITIIRALDMLSEQTHNKTLKKAIFEVKVSIEKGDTFASAMTAQDDIFPSILINMVEAAEASGSLETCFSRMAIHFEKSAKLKSVVKKAMIYPIFVGVVAIAVILLMLMVVIPNFMEMFADLGTEMPPLTVMVINMSNTLLHYWYFYLIGIILIVLVLRVFASTDYGKHFFGRITLKFPILSAIIVKSASGNIGRTMSSLISSGITLPNAIGITAKGIKNSILQNVLLEAKKDVERGIPLSAPLEASGLFPPLLFNMMEIGEETGNLERMLVKVAEYYEEDVETATSSLVAIMEPLMIIVLALIVGVILGAIFQPMMSIYSAVEGV
jgi:type IV pilus assembly protein PilC